MKHARTNIKQVKPCRQQRAVLHVDKPLSASAPAWLLAVALCTASLHAQAQSQAPAPAAAATALTDGEVRKVDQAAGKLTLRHGRIDKLDMPAMTMVFRVADPKMLDGLKEGDKLRFSADRVQGALTVTVIERAK